ncbi:MAG: class I SAM-dependent methyltransferase [Actinobacteria bacterium]|nr:class I SAM-dependent methyltransferase [Actinomycetota bacterium]
MTGQKAGEASSRFTGGKGRDYFALQDRLAEQSAVLDLWKFAPYVSGGETVVDFGCGTGALLEKLSAARRIGVEVNDPARVRAQERGFTVVAATSELPDETADVVISNHALEHTLHPLLELRELRRVLKPDGRLILWLPLDDWRAQRKPRVDDKDHHLYTWTPLLLGNLLMEAEYTVEHAEVVASAWRYSYTQASRKLPASVYRALTFMTALGLRRRQVHGVARKNSQ